VDERQRCSGEGGRQKRSNDAADQEIFGQGNIRDMSGDCSEIVMNGQ
jgi:hypothetical protein